tara:strand:- start:1019 stop:1426 length:408 start_codon:yes stop_codon:yes gene_type:complete
MAGKIIADALEHSTAGSLDTQYVVNGSAKAWASFDQGATGHPVYANSSLNTASTTDVAAGVTKLTFTNSFSNATYSISGATQSQNTGGVCFSVWGYATTNGQQTTTSDFHTDFRNSGGTGTDSDYTAYQVVGGLA